MTTTRTTAPVLSDTAHEFLAPPRFAVVATVNPDGSPLQVVVWYELVGDTIVFNSRVGRQWPTNLARDPHVSFIVADGYDYLEIRGVVEIDEDPVRGQSVIAELAHRYHSDPAEAAAQIETFAAQRRVTFELRPKRVFERFRSR